MPMKGKNKSRARPAGRRQKAATKSRRAPRPRQPQPVTPEGGRSAFDQTDVEEAEPMDWSEHSDVY